METLHHSHFWSLSFNKNPNNVFFLQPENVMLCARNSDDIKIIDFGLAMELDPDKAVKVMFGTPDFIAPEVVNHEPIGLPTDMWALGIMAYLM